MAEERDALRDWHRLFGLLLADFFTGSPFTVEIERDLSEQQQFLDVVILRRGRGRITVRLPDGLEGLTAHNLITFKSHQESLDGWAMKELVGHYVAYRKLVSPKPSNLLSEDHFRLLAICARFPNNLAGQVPWQERQAGVYDCRWGTVDVRVIVAGQLPPEPQNAPLHLFSASPELVGFGSGTYHRRSKKMSLMLRQLFHSPQGEGFSMSYTIDDFNREYLRSLPLKKRREVVQSLPLAERRAILKALPPAERREILEALPSEEDRKARNKLPLDIRREIVESLPLEDRLAGLSREQILEYLAGQPAESPNPRRKK